MPRDNTQIKPETLWAIWLPESGFVLKLSTRRRGAIALAEQVNNKPWADLRADGCRVVEVIVTPFDWGVMEAASKAQGVQS